MTHASDDQTPGETDEDAAAEKTAPAVDDRGANPADDVDDDADPHVDRQLDKGLKETFPASDPVSINPGAD
jgi:hypothetical protein